MATETAISKPVEATKPATAPDIVRGERQHEDFEQIPRIPIQRKLSIGSVDDPLEHEADVVASTVMRMPLTAFIQRKCSHCEEEEVVRRKHLGSFIQKKGTGAGEIAHDPISDKLQSGRGGGNPLSSDVRSFMEARFGTDFSDVRIHTGTGASDLSAALDARAFTTGNDIYFNQGEYQPGSYSGKELLAHELTHVVQQRDGTEQIQRQQPTPDQRRAALLAEFRSLYDRKARIVNGDEPVENAAAVDSRLQQVMQELQQLGIQLDQNSLYTALLANPAGVTTVTPTIVQDSDSLLRGQRAQFRVMLNFIPPGRQITYAWRWQRAGESVQYQFFSRGDRHSSNSVELEEAMWNFSLEDATGISVSVQVYIGTTAGPTASTRSIPIVTSEPSEIRLETPGTQIPVLGQYIDFQFSNWIPRFRNYSVEWVITQNGTAQIVATDQPRLRYRFDTTGSRTVTARIYRVQRGFWGTERTHHRDATITLDVLSAEQAGRRVLQSMTPDQLSSLRDTERSIGTSISSLRQSESFGGELAAYYRERREAQERRLAAIGRHVPQGRPITPMADNFFHTDQVDALGIYSRPIPAVLTMPDAQGAQPLNLHVVITGEEIPALRFTATILDLTSQNVTISTGSGTTPFAAYNAAIADWVSDHPYPRGGTVVYQRMNTTGVTVATFTTTNTRNTIEAWVDGILLIGGVVLLIVGSVATAGTATAAAVSVLGPVFLALSTARGIYGIYQNVERGGELFSSQNVLEAVAIAANFIGVGGTVLRQIGLRSGYRALSYRVGSYMVLTSVATDAGTLLYISAEGLRQMEAIRSDPSLDEGQKSMALIQLMSRLIVSGAIFVFSNRDLFRGGLRRSDFIPTNARAVASAQAGTTGRVELEPGQRLDIGLELRRLGDTPERLRLLSVPDASAGHRELVDRMTLATSWMERSLARTEIQSFLPRMNTDTLAGLSNIPAREAFDLANRMRTALTNDDLLQALAPVLGGVRLRDLEGAVGIPHVNALNTSFGAANLRTLIDVLEVQRIQRLLNGSNAAELHAFAQDNILGLAALRNLGNDLSGVQVRTLLGTHGPATVKWAATDLTGNDVLHLLSRLDPPAAAGLRDVTGREAMLLLGQYQPALLNQLSPTVNGTNLLTYLQAVGPETARGRAERLIDRNRVADMNDYAANLARARAAGGALDNPPPLGPQSFVADTNYMNRLAEANAAIAAGTPVGALTIPQQNALAFQAQLPAGAGGNVDMRMPNQALAEHGIRPGAPAYRGLAIPETARNTAEYRGLLQTLEANGVGGTGATGAADRSIVADLFIVPPAPGRNTAFVTADQNIFRGLARLGGHAPLPGRSLLNSYPNGFTVTVNVGGTPRTIHVVYIRGDVVTATPPVVP